MTNLALQKKSDTEHYHTVKRLGFIRQVARSPLSLKWFLILVLFRPVIDTMYDLKHVSIFASPLYWIGVLTPVFIIISILSKRTRIAGDASFVIWFTIILFNSAIILVAGRSIADSLEAVLKITTIGFVYFYIRAMALSEEQYILLIKCVAFSGMFVYIYIVLESVGLDAGWGGRTSSGVEQMVGPFADAVSYGMYLNLVLVAWLYLAFKAAVTARWWIVLVVIMTVYGIASIAHIASMSLMACILLLYLISVLKERRTAVFLGVAFLLVIGYGLTSDIVDERYQPKIDRELQVLQGERSNAQAFHGRMTRWNAMLPVWNEMNALSKILGVSLEMDRIRNHSFWVLIQPHNDFLRILFVSGIVGLLFYLAWLIKGVRRSLMLKGPDKFVAQSAFLIVFVYSISTLPTLYPAVMYFVVSTVGYFETNNPVMSE